MKQAWILIVAILVVAAGAYSLIYLKPAPASTSTAQSATATFYCSNNSSILATFTQNQVALALSDGRNLTLPQAMSGSGIRYEASTTSSDIVFSSEGEDATLMEEGQTTYDNCIAAEITPAGTNSFTYEDAAHTFSFTYPGDLEINGAEGGYVQDWMTNATTTGLMLASLSLSSSFEPNTNFGDARFRVGVSADPSAVAECLTYNPTGGPTSTPADVTINGVPFVEFHSQDAGAGQRYDTTSYRTVYNQQCYAIEYTIHYGAIENYTTGTVAAFDETKVAQLLDSVAQSFNFVQ